MSENVVILNKCAYFIIGMSFLSDVLFCVLLIFGAYVGVKFILSTIFNWGQNND